MIPNQGVLQNVRTMNLLTLVKMTSASKGKPAAMLGRIVKQPKMMSLKHRVVPHAFAPFAKGRIRSLFPSRFGPRHKCQGTT